MTTSSSLRNFFSSPVFPEDENKSRSAYYISRIVPVGILALIVLILLRTTLDVDLFDISNLVLAAVGGILFLAWMAVKAGAVRLAGYTTVGAIWLASTILAWSGGGLRGVGFVSYFSVMLLAGLVLGARAAAGVALISTISGFGLAYAETAGLIQTAMDPPFVVAVEFSFVFFISTILLGLVINSLQNALEAARENAGKLTVSNEELTRLSIVLDERVRERTATLEKRASQLLIISSMARSIAAITDLDSLLANTARLISEQFGIYHAGIFLLDESGQYAILKAANSAGGRQMLARGHHLHLDSNSIVGYVASHGEPRIALDVGADSVFFNNPDLPDTRSEMALPLLIGGKLIGVLDAQSKETNAFVQEDISVLSTLADQVAIAIENARLHDESQKALTESRATFDRYVRQEWSSFAGQVKHTGFVYDGKQVIPLEEKLKRDQVPAAIHTGKPNGQDSSTLRLPIKLRGQTIGVLDVRSKGGEREWTRAEITLLEAAAERAGLALENARLLESAQRRASRERSIGEISARIGSVSDIDSILQTAVEELGRKLSGASEVTLEIDSEQI